MKVLVVEHEALVREMAVVSRTDAAFEGIELAGRVDPNDRDYLIRTACSGREDPAG